jgi:ABC-type bacteriocin/lantibiotic exporter with double-glycine peptidase domain
MNSSIQLISLLHLLWRELSIRRKYQFFLLFFLIIASSIAEIFSLGIVLPFISLLINPESSEQFRFLGRAYQLLGLDVNAQAVLVITGLFVSATLLSSLLRAILVWSMTKFSYGSGAELSLKIYNRMLNSNYEYHLNSSSDEIISIISTKTNSAIGAILMTLNLFSSCILAISIFGFLLYIDIFLACFIFLVLGAIYAAIIFFVRNIFIKNSKIIALESTNTIKVLQEGLGMIKDILMDGSQKLFCELFNQADLRQRQAQGNSHFLGLAPKFFIEALVISLIAIVACYLAITQQLIAASLPIFGVLILGSQKLLPLLQQIYVSWSGIEIAQASMADTLRILKNDEINTKIDIDREPIIFNKDFSLVNLTFTYRGSQKPILSDLNLKIRFGECIGIVGKSGSGKTTLLNIMMGLLRPQTGQLIVDGEAIIFESLERWRRVVSHVPQDVYLFNATVAENITIKQKNDLIDWDLLQWAASKAAILDEINSWPMGFNTIIGERGGRLSGGQRQRIAIARALYKSSKFIVFDEATSALDAKTESEVMDTIYSLSSYATIVLVSHNPKCLTRCNSIYEIKSGVLMSKT